MASAVEFGISLRDNASGGLEKIGAEFANNERGSTELGKAMTSLQTKTDGLGKSTTKLGGSLSSLSGTMAKTGSNSNLDQISSMLQEGADKAQALQSAEAQLANTMQNMGIYSEAAYKKNIEGAETLSSGINYSTADIIGLQSQFYLLGNIGQNEMQKLTMASADMSTKFGLSLQDAGSMLANAVNSPDIMNKLASMLHIDPNDVSNIENLAKNGQEAAARLKLVGIVQDKIGGSAKAAFDSDPSALYKKSIEDLQTAFGDMAIAIQVCTALQWLLNIAMEANEVGLIIALVVALIAAISYVIYKTDGWGKTWHNVTELMKTSFQLFIANTVIVWDMFEGLIMAGVDKVMRKWYKLKAMFGDTSAAASLKQLDADGNARAKAFQDDWNNQQKLQKKYNDLKSKPIIELKWNNKGLGDLVGDVKKTLGMDAVSKAYIPATVKNKQNNINHNGNTRKAAAKETATSVASGGTRNNQITINLGKMVENIVFNGSVKENSQDLTRQLEDALVRVLYAAQNAG